VADFSEIEFAHPILITSIASDYGINFKVSRISMLVDVRLVKRDEHAIVELDFQTCQIISGAAADERGADSLAITAPVGLIAFESVEVVVDANTAHDQQKICSRIGSRGRHRLRRRDRIWTTTYSTSATAVCTYWRG
jgi:hypothetical protein